MRLLTVLICLVTLACSAVKPPLYRVVNSPQYSQENVQPLDPPTHYAVWWKLTEECLGSRADQYEWDEIKWYTVDRAANRGQELLGFHMDGSIFLRRSEVDDEQVVRHEMVHALCSGCPAGPYHHVLAPYQRCTIGQHFLPDDPLAKP